MPTSVKTTPSRCRALGVAFSITVRPTPLVEDAIARIPEGEWREIFYTEGCVAQVGETIYKGTA